MDGSSFAPGWYFLSRAYLLLWGKVFRLGDHVVFLDWGCGEREKTGSDILFAAPSSANQLLPGRCAAIKIAPNREFAILKPKL
jgi:hypothetical protein